MLTYTKILVAATLGDLTKTSGDHLTAAVYQQQLMLAIEA
jgi:hypothetical protein